MRAAGWMVVALLLGGPAAAQATEDAPAEDWSFLAAAYGYFVPDDRDFVLATFSADRARLHLEARYNYENLDTGSVWLGYNLGGGHDVAWELTPLFGGVFGDTSGVAPGYKGLVGWRRLELYSEGEYVVDTGDSSESFFYNWSELTLAPLDWFRFGVLTQRTRVYQTEREIQRGLLVGFSYKSLDLLGYVLNPDDSDPTVILAAAFAF